MIQNRRGSRDSHIQLVSNLRACWQLRIRGDPSWPSAITALSHLLQEALAAEDVDLLPEHCETLVQSVQRIHSLVAAVPEGGPADVEELRRDHLTGNTCAAASPTDLASRLGSCRRGTPSWPVALVDLSQFLAEALASADVRLRPEQCCAIQLAAQHMRRSVARMEIFIGEIKSLQAVSTFSEATLNGMPLRWVLETDGDLLFIVRASSM